MYSLIFVLSATAAWIHTLLNFQEYLSYIQRFQQKYLQFLNTVFSFASLYMSFSLFRVLWVSFLHQAYSCWLRFSPEGNICFCCVFCTSWASWVNLHISIIMLYYNNLLICFPSTRFVEGKHLTVYSHKMLFKIWCMSD